ncbi:SEL1-like repeat protein [Salinimonas chungwhensis]|uniref:hypothetical protein n=1 Tax=Salinimonas chungwhensis TaxID=265425 RepID=UPI00037AE15E|nr:hypothetical protein [Salinimonas chungwhensis]
MALKEEAAEASYALAQYDVAGDDFKQDDFAKALSWLQRAAEQGDRSALFATALLYSEKTTRYTTRLKLGNIFCYYQNLPAAND